MARRAHRQSDRWDAHPILGGWVRVAVVLVPLLVSVVVALVAVTVLPTAHTLPTEIAWWLTVLGSAYLAAYGVDRLARRALPLAALLQLSLVFPDRAPSRLKTARRTSLREIERQVSDLEAAGEPAQAAHTLVSLVGALGLHDKRTRGHSERVRAYVDLLTEEMGLHEEDRIRLRWSALVHDVGKLSVSKDVLNAGSDLAEDEWAALRRHPAEGDRLAAALMPWLGQWGRCVGEHHERWDGSGYPVGLSGTDISLGARIVAVADAYEVMTANRSYEPAISPAAAREELSRCAGADFDPAVVRAFLQISIGRLRGVLGPLSLLPAVPFAATADRAGQIVKGFTTVAAVTAVAIGFAPSDVHHRPAPRLALGAGAPRTSAPSAPIVTPAPSAAPTPTPTPAPAATPKPAPRPARVVPSAVPVPQPVPPASAALPDVLYLAASGGLVGSVPDAGTVTVARAATFVADVSSTTTLTGTPTLVLFHRLQATHGRGHPRAGVIAVLSACTGTTCRTLSSGSAVLERTRSGYVEQRLHLSALDVVLAAGDQLRLTVWLTGRTNVSALRVACGAKTASRLVLASQ